MDNMEFNKLFAAILVAGIAASLSGFISHKLVHAHSLHENAYKIEGVAEAAPGAAKAPAKPEPILALLASADAAKGAQIGKVCATCHNFAKGGPNAIGPNLWGVVNRAKGSHEGFAYSDGMHAKGGNWTFSDLNHFLWKPKDYVEGTKMNFVGLKKPEDRAAVLAWLRTLADSPAEMPSQGDIDAENAELAPAPAATTPAEPATPAAH
ncbi:MAG TPA: cytochrome c family protein [Micavibrio sp.]